MTSVKAIAGAMGERSGMIFGGTCRGMFETACVAGVYDKLGPAIRCNAGTIDTLIRTSAWYALRHAQQPDDNYETFRKTYATEHLIKGMPALGLTALNMAVHHDDPQFEQGLEAIRLEVERPDISGAGSKKAQIFSAIFDLVAAGIIGHESSHLEIVSPYCGIRTPSRLEDHGMFDILVRLQTSGELYAARPAVIDEVRADRCAARRIRAARTNLESGPLSATDQAFVRRAAADIIASFLFLKYDESAKGFYPLFVDPYLYPSSRILALTADLDLDSNGPVLCGGAAEVMVQSVQETLNSYPGNYEMPDEMAEMLPTDVIKAWGGNAWTYDTFSCNASEVLTK